MTLTLFKPNIKPVSIKHFDILNLQNVRWHQALVTCYTSTASQFLRKEGINEVRRTLEKSNRQTD